MNKIKLFISVMILAVILISGCVSKSTPEIGTTTPKATTTPNTTISSTSTMDIANMSVSQLRAEIERLDAEIAISKGSEGPIYAIYPGYEYRPTVVQELYSNEIDRAFVQIQATVLGEGMEYYNNESGKTERAFQVYGEPDANYEIEVLYITVPVEKITGVIKPESQVLVYGYFDNNIWFEGSNKYGTTIRQPRIFAHNVTALLKKTTQSLQWEGKGNLNTSVFHINSTSWTIDWSNEPSEFPGEWSFKVNIYTSDNKSHRTFRASMSTDSGVTGLDGPGDYYLNIITNEKYLVKVNG